MITYFCGFLTAFLVTFIAIPPIIRVAKEKRLFDTMDGEQKLHTVKTPALGGIAIFAGIFMALSFWLPAEFYGEFKYILSGLLIVFFIGVKDDLIPMSPSKKFIGQLAAVTLIVVFSNLKLTNLHGILGIHEIHDWISRALFIFIMLAVINGFNLLDGINGLTGSISLLVAIALGVWFVAEGVTDYALFAFATAGAAAAFLKYNISPASIFMGDTGSMIFGLIAATLTLKLITVLGIQQHSIYFSFSQGLVIAFGILILPLFDMTRVAATRVAKGKSPFYPDRTHIHHLLLDCGLSHMKATYLLVLSNIGFILLALVLQEVFQDTQIAIFILLLTAITSVILVQRAVNQKKRLTIAVQQKTIPIRPTELEKAVAD